MIIVLIIGYGWYSIMTIPKESAPDIKFGIVSIATIYAWASPVDIDSQITTKIENEIKNLDGIDKIKSTSNLWSSFVTVTLDNGVDVQNFINEVKTKIDPIVFPTDVKIPVVSELSTENEKLFDMVLYAPKDIFTINQIRSLAMSFKTDIKWKWWIVDVVIEWIKWDSDYDVSVLLDKSKVENYWLTIWQVVWQIRSYNTSTPLWNHDLWNLNYDYRIDNELNTLSDLQKVPIRVGGTYIYLSDISKIERKYKNTSYSYGGVYQDGNNYAVSVSILKNNGINIFQIAPSAKQIINQTLKKVKYRDVKYQYTLDLADTIIDDYSSLGSNGASSIFLVLLITSLFIWFRQSLIATALMILSFFITFIVLKSLGRTMNFMTNFSLILAFGSGIDTVIVFIEAAYENMKRGFNPKTAMLIAINTYKSANINTSLINLCVFIPLLSLPGITGKFLSFIPITIFATLLGSLILSLTINGAVFSKINKPLKYFYGDSEIDSDIIMPEIEKQILEEEKIWKMTHEEYISQNIDKSENSINIYINPKNRWWIIFDFVERWLHKLENIYISGLKKVISSRMVRILWIVWPVVALVLSFVFLSSKIWFKLFPSGDNPVMNIQIIAKEWTKTEYMNEIWSWISNMVANISGVKSFDVLIQNNKIDLWIYLVKKWERNKNSFEILDQVNSWLDYFKTEWFKVEWKVQAGWPPTEKAVGIKLVANDSEDLSKLKTVASDFENYLKSLTGSTNVNSSSKESPGQFEYIFDADKLSQLWLSPSDIQSELYISINGLKAGSVNIESIDRDIVVKLDKFNDNITPELISNTIINTKAWPINIWSIANVKVAKSVNNITKEDGDIVMTVDADTADGFKPTDIQPKLLAFADEYQFPSGISTKAGGENAANADLIQATWVAFVISMLIAFVILVYQFNSFGLTLIVLYSVLTALLGVNVWLYITKNPYSMPVVIWFISLIWVVVNTAIFLVDRIKYNLEHGADIDRAIIEAWSLRFKPIIISSITTILGIWSVVTQDEFYAALGWTIIFGLLFSAVITLMAVPALVYSIKAPKRSIESKKL